MHFVCVLLTGETCKSQITMFPYPGWGLTYSCAPSIPTPILQEVEVPIVSDTVCEAASSNSPFNAPTIGGCATFLNVNYTNLISPDMVCAGSAGKIVHTYYLVILEQ